MNFERTIKKGLLKKKSSISVFLIRFLHKKMLHKMVPIPLGIIGFVFGKCGRNLRAIEEETLIQKLKKNRFLQILMNFHDFSKNPILIYYFYISRRSWSCWSSWRVTSSDMEPGSIRATPNSLPEFRILKISTFEKSITFRKEKKLSSFLRLHKFQNK